MQKHLFGGLIGFATIVAGLAACGDSSESTGTGGTGGGATSSSSTTSSSTSSTSSGNTGSASLRVIHASPDAPAVDVYAKGVDTPLVKNLAYGSASDFFTVPAGTYTVELRAAGAPSSDPPAFSTGPITVADGQKLDAVAAGLLGSQDAGDKLRILALEEKYAAAGSGKARVRVLHAGSDAPTVDLDVGNDDPTNAELKGLARFADTGTDGVELPAGQALQLGIAAGGKRVTAFTSPPLPDGGQLLVIATGLVGKLAREPQGFGLLAVITGPTTALIKQNPIVYALHAGPDAPAVDVFAGNGELVDNLSFGKLSGPIQVPPAQYTLDFYPHSAGSTKPAGNPAYSAPVGPVAAGEQYLAIATGFLNPPSGGKPFQLAALKEGFDLSDPSKAFLRVVHACPDAPAVDIGPLANGAIQPLIPNLAFPNATDEKGLGLPPAALSIGVTPAGMNSTVVAKFNLTTVAGLRALGIAAGSLAPSAANKFGLLVVNTAASPWTVTPVAPTP